MYTEFVIWCGICSTYLTLHEFKEVSNTQVPKFCLNHVLFYNILKCALIYNEYNITLFKVVPMYSLDDTKGYT